MPSAYVRSLQRSLETKEISTELSRPDIKSRFLSWLDSQPEISRFRAYSMTELEKALGTQGRHLSPILLELGWERRRKWTSKTQYLRYWMPPET